MKYTHGSEAVEAGRLRGATDTDYFYFFCPNCPDDRLLRILDFQILRDQKGHPYNDKINPKAVRSFIIAFDIICDNCGLRDCVKVSNIGWQGGKHSDALR